MHEHDNQRELVAETGTESRGRYQSNSFVIVSGMTAKHEPVKEYKRLTLFRQWKNKL
jgi:hypothetical protein